MSKIDDLVRQGLERHQAGQRDQATAFYLKALAKQPSHAAANHLLGVALLQSGRAVEAVPRLERAVRMNPSAEYLGNLGTALNAAGRPLDALAAFDAALRLQPASPGVHNNRGMALKALFRHEEAIAAYREAIALLPGEASFRRNLGNALAELGDWHGAEAAYREALEIRPGFPNAVTGLGNALLALGRSIEAISELAALSQRFPKEPEIHRALGHALWQTGDSKGAATAYRRAIAIHPADVEAHRLLGLIVARAPGDAEVLAAERLLTGGALSPNQRAQLEFTLGQASEDVGDRESALVHFSRANRLVSESAPFDIAAGLSQIDAIIASFDALPDSELPALQPPTGPIFIVGLPRSGKTTLERLLAMHPRVFPAGELQALGIMAANPANRGDSVTGTALTPDAAAKLGRAYLAMADRLAPGFRVVDTMPNNFLLAGVLRQAIPSARILFCHRDPRAHAAALYTKYYALAGNGYAADLGDTLAYLAATSRLRAAWESRLPRFLRSVDTGQLSPQLQEIATFLGLDGIAPPSSAVQTEPRLMNGISGGDPGKAALLAEIDRLMAATGTAS